MRCWRSAATYRAIYVDKPKAAPISKETARDLHGRFRPAVSLVRMAVARRPAARPDSIRTDL